MSVRSRGFISRGFLGLGNLMVTRGFGPCTDGILASTEQSAVQENTGIATQISVTVTEPPRAMIMRLPKKRR